MDKKLQNFLDFILFLDKFQNTKRVVYCIDSDQIEDDIQHTYKLTMCCWYLIHEHKLKLNLQKVFKYVLAHDLVEIYAKDTNIFVPSELATKKHREHESLQKILLEYPFLGKIIKKYEQKKDSESVFVYALDKLTVNLETYLDGGRSWKDLLKISLEELIVAKTGKIDQDRLVATYWQELLKILKPKKKDLFYYE